MGAVCAAFMRARIMTAVDALLYPSFILGATGAILLGTLLDELERQDKRYGVVTLCIGHGMAVATLIDRKI